MRVGFIGLGKMGSGMALNILAGGHELTVHDIARSAAQAHLDGGAKWADSVADLAAQSDVVMTSLPGPKEVSAVAETLIGSMKRGGVWFDLSTNSPTVVRTLAARCAEAGITMLDSPVSGGPHGAKSGKLALWIGGDRSAFDKYKPLLDCIGDEILYIGEIGAGSIAKLVHNCASYTVQTALAEVFCLGVKAGLPALDLWAAVRQGGLGRRRTFDRLQKQFLQGEFDPPDFALKLAFKDITLATDLARELNVPMRVASLTHSDMVESLNRGWGDRDSRIPMWLQEERSGVSIKVPKADIQEVLRKEKE